MLCGDIEGSLQGDAGTAQGAFVEEAADEGDAVGDAAGRGELWAADVLGSGAQSLRASETSTKPARRVSEGWPVKLVMVSISSRREGTRSRSTSCDDAGHLLRDLAAEAVGLDEVDGGEEARLAEGVGPGVGDLRFELVELRG